MLARGANGQGKTNGTFMSEMRDVLVDAAAKLFGDLCTNQRFEVAERGGFNDDAWDQLEAAGLTRATVSEARGGAGADLGDALALVREAGRVALPLPLADTLLAEIVLAAAGLPPQSGVGAVGPVVELAPHEAGKGGLTLAKRARGWELSGTLYRIPSARHARYLVALALFESRWTSVVVRNDDLQRAVVKQDANWANEPRDTLTFKGVVLATDAVGKPGKGYTPETLKFMGALFRLVAMAGAMGRILRLTVQYAKDRVQFGRPIGQFQAVQHQLAVLASQVAAASAAADAVTDAVSRGPAQFEIAAAKARIGEAAHIACGIAHQVHGAMGFTYEHELHRSTRRLWAWRDEFGTEVEWAEWIGQVVARLGGARLWPFLTSGDKKLPASTRGALPKKRTLAPRKAAPGRKPVGKPAIRKSTRKAVAKRLRAKS